MFKTKQKMKKIVFAVVASVLFSFHSQAQTTFKKDDLDINIGMGIASHMYRGTNVTAGIPAISISSDWGWEDRYGPGVIGFGGIIGFSSFKEVYVGATYKYSELIIGGRGSYHIELLKDLDTYACVGLYYHNITTSSNLVPGYDPVEAILHPGLIVGAKYFLTRDLAAFCELGYDISAITIGAAFRFR